MQSGDTRINQDGLVPTARTLTNAVPLDVSLVDGAGNQLVGFDASRPASSALTAVPVSVTSVVLLAANAARRQFTIFNSSSKLLSIAFAATASATAFTTQLPSGGLYESPADGYTGVVSGIWAGADATKSAHITEITT